MEFINLGSSSSGNCYVFKHKEECVLVECGFEYRKIIEKLHQNGIVVSQIKGIITTHIHNDHSKSIDDFAICGVSVYTPWRDEKTFYEITSWLSAYCFPVRHDPDIRAYGFVFFNKETKETILFINDTKCFELPADVRSLKYDYIFIECNHIRKQLEAVLQKALDNQENGNCVKYKRQALCHMSLAATKKMMRMLNLSKVKAVFLMHLSKEVSNKVIMKEEIATVFKVKTFVCERHGGFF